MITIIDYQAGNINSVQNMLKRLGYDSCVSSCPEEISRADKLILPGVGSFDYGMEMLHSHNLVPVLNELVVDRKVPILGICLGAQLFTKSSEEGKMEGLGWFSSAKTVMFRNNGQSNFKIPHMGWSGIDLQKPSKLFADLNDEMRFYFVHSYHIECADRENILATSTYGYNFVSAIEHSNIIGVQFHPEKSHKYGMGILKNFVERY
ncbi:imidazole glycerol phosphate synthase subunit HisH [Schleiferiaceae bacterium]|nr:imidazole glycerol phosphate synthase subunit HisH [Schleiferiaceae bacterium]